MNIREFWNKRSYDLTENDVSNGRAAARLLLMKVLGVDYAKFICSLDQAIADKEALKYQMLHEQLVLGRPLQYILGTQEFRGLSMEVDERVLIPRPETELLVDVVLDKMPIDKEIWLADIGTGSGAIAISLAVNLPLAKFTAIDINTDALQVAKQNAETHNVASRINFVQGNMLDLLPLKDERYTAIVSNPPYITRDEMLSLPKEVHYEPSVALFGGDDGLKYYRQIVSKAPRVLVDGGLLAVEIGWQQGLSVTRLFQEAGFKAVEVLKDFAGRDRIVRGIR